jgi:hypothetical protein
MLLIGIVLCANFRISNELSKDDHLQPIAVAIKLVFVKVPVVMSSRIYLRIILGGYIMKELEQIELDAYRGEIIDDMQSMVNKYRRIFGWDIPDIDQHAADKLILTAMHSALENIISKFSGSRQ